jgi:hypothetical protein
LGQEIINYFIEIYEYDRYNFFDKIAKTYYQKIRNHAYDVMLYDDKIITKISELFSNKYWKKEYPPLNGVLYMDVSDNGSNQIYGVETLIFVNELILNNIKSIYINDGYHFVDNKSNVTNTDNNVFIHINLLATYLDRHIDASKYVSIGGMNKSINKFNKYNKKINNLINIII